MKATISYVIRNYKLIASTDPKHELILCNELVLIAKNGQMMTLEKR